MDVSIIGGSLVRLAIGLGTVLCGIAGIYCSSMIYRVPARPAWDSRKTTIDFFDVAAMLGPVSFIVASVVAILIAGREIGFLLGAMQAAAVFAACAFIFKHTKNAYIINKWLESDTHELKASARLRIEHFYRLRMIRNTIGIAGLFALVPFMAGNALPVAGQVSMALLALGLFTAVSFINRYIFFVSVVPRNIPGNYIIASRSEVH